MFINTDTSTITIVAWWGAIVSTVVFLWDIYKWRTSGAKIRMSVQTGMKSINIPIFEGKNLTITNVINYGDRPTTITNVALQYYSSWYAFYRKKPKKSFVLPNPNPSYPLPYELKQGAVWSAIGEQTEDIVQMANSGILVCELYHSHRTKPEKRRIIINKIS
ncbi:MAG: hypothetical protein V4525_10905 [Pseudomonadota bacterium]